MSDRAYVATRKGLFELRRRGRTWDVANVHLFGVPITMILADSRDGTVYAALNHGHFGTKLHRAANGGKWEEVTTPAFPPDAADKPALQQIWGFGTGPASEPGTLYAGACPVALFRSPDRGMSWELVRALWDLPERKSWTGAAGFEAGAIHSISQDPRDAKRVVVAMSGGGVWETCDAGETWRHRTKGVYATYTPPELREDPSQQDPHCVIRCHADPDVMWMQHHNGIFRTTDCGAQWHEIKAPVSSFGFVVASHPRDPRTAWFAPAISDELRVPKDGQLCVNRTRDGGKTFQTLREGLPQAHAYDLVYRHGLDVDADGEQLVMGSTTGGVWTSADGGDTWAAIPARLPPVYAVRFG